MWFMEYIVARCQDIADHFYNAYLTVFDWVWPFNLLASPLYYICYAFTYLAYYFGEFDDWLEWAAGELDRILDTWDIWSYFRTWFDAAANAWDWIKDAVVNVFDIADAWWSSAKYEVLVWISNVRAEVNSIIDDIARDLAEIRAAWESFQVKIPAVDEVIVWWSTWDTYIHTYINNWWTARIRDVQGLIDSAFKDREPFWSGWQDWRGQVVEFFTDPEDWLYKAMDRIIERFW